MTGARGTLRCFGVALLCASILSSQSAPTTRGANSALSVGESRSDGITGVVEGVDGLPVAGAVCEINEDTSWETCCHESGELRGAVTTARDGRFFFPRSALGIRESFVLRVRHPSHAPLTMALSLRSIWDLHVVLSRGFSLSGTVLDERGKPIEGATVSVVRAWNGSRREMVDDLARTDREGRFVAEHVVPGDRFVQAARTGFATVRRSIETEPVELDLVLRRGGTIRGRVVDAETASPIAGARVRAVQSRPEKGESRPCGVDLFLSLGALSSADGSYVIEGPDSCAHRVSVYARGYLSPDSADLPKRLVENTPAEGIDFRLVRSARIAGRVVDDETGLPVETFIAGLGTSNAGQFLADPYQRPPVTLVAGRFEIQDACPGKAHSIFVLAPGYAEGRAGEVFVPAGERSAQVEVRLLHGANVGGRVVDQEGKPVAGATIEVRAAVEPSDNRARAMKIGTRSSSPWTRSGSDGTFTVRNLFPGPCRLAVLHPDFGPGETPVITAPGFGTIAFPDIAVARGARIRGTVMTRDETADTRATVSVWLIGSDRWSHRRGATDARGVYEVSGLAVGRYTVTISNREGMSIMNPSRDWRFDSRAPENQPREITVEAGAVGRVDF